jgi:signal peptidase I
MNEIQTQRRQPLSAAILSLLSTGLGHIYCGRIATGLGLFLASLLFAPIALAAALMAPATQLLVVVIVTFLGVLGVYLFAVVDAWRTARNMAADYQLKEYNRTGLYALFVLVGITYPVLIGSFLRADVFEGFYLPTNSMSPNFVAGDHVLVNKLALRYRFPKRGDVVVFRTPDARRLVWIKRVIALPGDTVTVRGHELLVNGKKLEHDRAPAAGVAISGERLTGHLVYETNSASRYLVMLGRDSSSAPDFPEKKVPEGALFVLGDNRDLSSDSRDLGFVPLGDLLGYVQYIYLPADSWSRFGACRD